MLGRVGVEVGAGRGIDWKHCQFIVCWICPDSGKGYDTISQECLFYISEFKSFYDDAISLRIKNNFQVSTNANKDENKGHLWNGNTSIPVISVREHGIRNKNVHPNDHDFHGGEHRPPGGLHHGLLPTCSYHMLRFPHSQNDYNDHICNKQPSFLNPGHNYHLPERKVGWLSAKLSG